MACFSLLCVFQLVEPQPHFSARILGAIQFRHQSFCQPWQKSVLAGANLRLMNRVLFSLPMVGDITLTRIMGTIVGLLGVAVLTGFDPLSLEDEV